MKRLMILGIVALAATSTGCCRTWSGWFNRGVTCDSCVSGVPVQSYSSGSLVAPPAEILPGPAEVIVPRG